MEQIKLHVETFQANHDGIAHPGSLMRLMESSRIVFFRQVDPTLPSDISYARTASDKDEVTGKRSGYNLVDVLKDAGRMVVKLEWLNMIGDMHRMGTYKFTTQLTSIGQSTLRFDVVIQETGESHAVVGYGGSIIVATSHPNMRPTPIPSPYREDIGGLIEGLKKQGLLLQAPDFLDIPRTINQPFSLAKRVGVYERVWEVPDSAIDNLRHVNHSNYMEVFYDTVVMMVASLHARGNGTGTGNGNGNGNGGSELPPTNPEMELTTLDYVTEALLGDKLSVRVWIEGYKPTDRAVFRGEMLLLSRSPTARGGPREPYTLICRGVIALRGHRLHTRAKL